MNFVNREKELQNLEKEYQRPGSSFVVIYGRRRVGKTTLITEFIKNKPAVYFLADTQNEILQLNRLKDIIAEQQNDDVLKNLDIQSWDTLFQYLQKQLKPGRKLILVIDEFQYLARVNKAVPSIFQRIWDQLLKDKDIMLILCGSVISMMYKTTLSYDSPLYGRRTGQLKLAPLRFNHFTQFFKDKSPVQQIELYALLSGIPKYIEIFSDSGDMFESIEENIIDKDAFLYHEPLYILNEELSETTTYFSILEIISRGEHKIGNIATRLQMPTSNLTSFLNRLIDLEIIEREVPVTEENPAKSKRGLYFIKDYFFRFWFRYVMPYRSYIEIENKKFVLSKVRETFHLFVSQAYEKVCIQQLLEHPPVEIHKIGRWWNNKEEIDIVTLSDDCILAGECKWTSQPVGLDVLHRLEQKTGLLPIKNKKIHLALFSKSGFKPELQKRAQEQGNIYLYECLEKVNDGGVK